MGAFETKLKKKLDVIDGKDKQRKMQRKHDKIKRMKTAKTAVAKDAGYVIAAVAVLGLVYLGWRIYRTERSK